MQLWYNEIMKIVDAKTDKAELLNTAETIFDGAMIKAVVDVKKKVIAVDAQLHADLEHLLLEHESNQADLWGINLWCDSEDLEDLIEFDSMINVRPRQNNRSRYVEDERIRTQITEVVQKWIK